MLVYMLNNITYTIINTILQNDYVLTIVEYNIDGNIIIVEVPHFKPKNDDEILFGINNRGITEMYKLFPDRIPLPPPSIIDVEE